MACKRNTLALFLGGAEYCWKPFAIESYAVSFVLCYYWGTIITVQVLHDIYNGTLLEGEILCCHNINFSWRLFEQSCRQLTLGCCEVVPAFSARLAVAMHQGAVEGKRSQGGLPCAHKMISSVVPWGSGSMQTRCHISDDGSQNWVELLYRQQIYIPEPQSLLHHFWMKRALTNDLSDGMNENYIQV